MFWSQSYLKWDHVIIFYFPFQFTCSVSYLPASESHSAAGRPAYAIYFKPLGLKMYTRNTAPKSWSGTQFYTLSLLKLPKLFYFFPPLPLINSTANTQQMMNLLTKGRTLLPISKFTSFRRFVFLLQFVASKSVTNLHSESLCRATWIQWGVRMTICLHCW